MGRPRPERVEPRCLADDRTCGDARGSRGHADVGPRAPRSVRGRSPEGPRERRRSRGGGGRGARAPGVAGASQESCTIHPDTKSPPPAHRTIDEDLEALVWERAARVTVVTRTIAERDGRRYPAPAPKTRVLYNGFDPDDVRSAPATGEGPFTITYTGSFYPHTPPSTLLRALEGLRAEGAVSADRVQVEFLGRPEATVEAEILARGLEGIVHLRGFRPLREATEAAGRADLLYLL